ncbi:hypothetical protein HFK18_12085|uniref:hypothetical protein n=1 Tax=Stenotrophomonas TaxID=40323 RepID=UPI0015D1432B|nr:hypothetical protein [Stenotrophomonas sp. SbOxS2]NYT99223.1 hypothetical protein [Stenotrophomonas sp. SbOxS2]
MEGKPLVRQAIRIVFAAVAIALMAGCAPQYYVAQPTSGAGRVCAAGCAQRHLQCAGLARSMAETAQQSCQADKARVIDTCSDIADEKMRHRCEGARGAGAYCATAANTRACDATRAQCVLDCGGSVSEIRSSGSLPVY